MSLRHLLDRTGFHPIRFELPRWNIPLPPTDGCFAMLERVGLNAVLSLGKLIGMGGGDDVLGRSIVKMADRCLRRYGY